MARPVTPAKSPRHGFAFNQVPTVSGGMYGGGIVKHDPDSYGPILDCVYEMADDIATGNGVTPEAAIETVCKDEGWRLLPSHKKTIAAKLKELS